MEVAIYKLNVKKSLDSLKVAEISKANKKLILNFINFCFSEGIGEHRVLKYLSILKITCFIPKLFRANYVGCNPLSIVKLNEKKIRWIIAQKLKGESTSTIAEIQGISARRVQQIYKEYVETNQLPQVGNNLGRPRKQLSSDDKELIDQTYSEYKFGACYLEIPSKANTIVRYLITESITIYSV